MDDAFLSATPDDEVLFEVAVTKAWMRQVIVGLTLICRSSYRGIVEFVRDLLGSLSQLCANAQLWVTTTRYAEISSMLPTQGGALPLEIESHLT